MDEPTIKKIRRLFLLTTAVVAVVWGAQFAQALRDAELGSWVTAGAAFVAVMLVSFTSRVVDRAVSRNDRECCRHSDTSDVRSSPSQRET